MELTALQSVVCNRCIRDIGFPDPAFGLPVSDGPRGLPSTAVPRLLTKSGSSSRELSLSFRVLRFGPAHGLPAIGPFLGVSSPLRRQPVESTLASIPSPLRSALRVSHPPSGLLLPRPCGSISPRSHIRDFPSGFLPPSQPYHLVDGRCPLAVSLTLLPPACAESSR